MSLAVSDLTEYRRRRETKREQDLRVELTAVAEDVEDSLSRIEPEMRRLWIVAREMGPAAMHSWNAVSYEHQRLAALVAVDTGPEAA